MEDISRQLLYQRLRSRVIELLDIYSSFDNIATLGAFEMIDMVGDWLPLDYEAAPNIFSEKEKEAIAVFLELAEKAADATDEDTWNIEWFKSSEEWVRVSTSARTAFVIFSKRGRFSEEHEEALTAE